MSERNGYDIGNILDDEVKLEKAYSHLTDIVLVIDQMRMNVTPRPYVGPHYSLEDGNAIIEATRSILTFGSYLESNKRIGETWQKEQVTVAEIYHHDVDDAE